MRWIWCGGIVLSAVLVSVAYADTVYLKDGQAVWGTESYEDGNEIVLIRPSGPVRYPKAQVERIEQSKVSLPRFYSVPTEAPTGSMPGGPGAAAVPGAPPAPGAGAPGVPGSPPPPSEGAAPGSPPGPTELPPAPPPPPPQ